MRTSILRSRFLQSAAILVATATAASADTTITISNENVLNLLSPFLDLSATPQALADNLGAAIATNNAAAASPVVAAVAMSGNTIFSAASGSITLTGGAKSCDGPGANLAAGLPEQALQDGQVLSQTEGQLRRLAPTRGARAGLKPG